MYITVIDGVVTLETGIPSLKFMQTVVGGYIESADRLEGVFPDTSIDIYCNEEGLLLSLPWTLMNRNGSDIVGNLIVVGGDEGTGDTIPLTPMDVDKALLYLTKQSGGMLTHSTDLR